MMKMPGVTRPCRNRQSASVVRLVALQVKKVQTASATMQAMMVRLRSSCSPKAASRAAEMATPSVAALMVMPTLVSVAWKTCAKSGRSGWTQ